jgi:hypothetical protein
LNKEQPRMAKRSYVALKVGDSYHILPRMPSSQPQHLLMVGAGAFLGVLGFRQRGMIGGLLLAAGGLLVASGLTGTDMIRRLGALCRRRHDDGGPSYANQNPKIRQTAMDDVEEASMQSFPASDAPARGVAGP